jgi:hypothetical protein
MPYFPTFERSTFELLRLAVNTNGLSLTELIEYPKETAYKLGHDITADGIRTISALKTLDRDLARKRRIDHVDTEIIESITKVAQDGSYIAEWLNNPKSVDYSLSRDAEYRIEKYHLNEFINPGNASWVYIIATVVIFVVYGCDDKTGVQTIIDTSGINKF